MIDAARRGTRGGEMTSSSSSDSISEESEADESISGNGGLRRAVIVVFPSMGAFSLPSGRCDNIVLFQVQMPELECPWMPGEWPWQNKATRNARSPDLLIFYYHFVYFINNKTISMMCDVRRKL
jgi:hypothetical protein